LVLSNNMVEVHLLHLLGGQLVRQHRGRQIEAGDLYQKVLKKNRQN
jgi:hypothetical protein